MNRFRCLRPFILALSTLSCQPETDISEPQTTSLITVEGWLLRDSPTVMLIIADDADTIEAAQLRDRLTQSLRAGLLRIIDHRWGTCLSPDPAQWHPGDVRIVVARPSAPDGEALLTPIEIPDLAWITQISKDEEIDAVMTAATEALGKRLAMPGETYRPLRAATRTIDLMFGNRMSANAAESEFLASLPKRFGLQVVLANSREDEDMQPVGQLVPVEKNNVHYSVIGPSMMGNTICNVNPLGSSRLESWAKQQDAEFIAWPCDYQNTWDNLIRTGPTSCGPSCQSRGIHVSPNGEAACKVLIDILDLASCDSAHGWRDPDGKSTVFNEHGLTIRRCEIVQHSGANLDACRHSLECPGCSSGYCVTEVPELVWPESYCSGNGATWPLRFTGGALGTQNAKISITCETGDN